MTTLKGSLAIAASVAALFTLSRAGAQTYEQGFTFRLFDIREDMDRLYPLIDGQAANVDEKHDIVDYESEASFGGFSDRFIVELSGRIEISTPGTYEFRLTSDDGSTLRIDDTLVVANDGVHAAIPEDGSLELAVGPHPFEVRYFENAGGQRLLLEWRPPGATAFVTVPAANFSTLANVTRVTAPGKKEILRPGGTTRPGNGAPLTGIHPSWRVTQARPASFEPKVGALAMHPDGRLFVATFEPNQFGFPEPGPGGDGKVFALTNTDQEDPGLITVTEVANGLSEPLGMRFIDGDLVVSQRLALTRLTDSTDDGFYDTHTTISDGWISDNYHHFHFGLVEKEGFAYTALSTAVNRSSDFDDPSLHRGLNGANPPNRGTLLRTNLATGEKSFIAGGMRTPNGLSTGPEDTILYCDNQGGWVPTSKIHVVKEGGFYGFYNDTFSTNADYPNGGEPSLFADQPVTPPAIWLPHSEVAKSPSELVPVDSGIFAGQYLFGEVTLGGIRRASFEKVGDTWQGCAYRFSQGFEGGVNRLVWDDAGALYVGCIGAAGNWSWRGTTFGLQRMVPKTNGTVAFEIKRVRAFPDGFEVEYTKPIDRSAASQPTSFLVEQWTYTATPDYGGAKQNQSSLPVSDAIVSPDGFRVRLVVPGLKEGFVHHIQADLPSSSGEQLWSTEAWYTLNVIPEAEPVAGANVAITNDTIEENAPAGTSVGSLSVNFADPNSAVVFTLLNGQLDNDSFAIDGDALVSARAFDFEQRDAFSAIVRATNNEGETVDSLLNITVSDVVNENAPTAIALDSHVLPLPASTGNRVGRILVTDLDLGDFATDAEVGSSEAVLLAEEPFDYAAGSLIGQNGGSGFSGAWSTVTGATNVVDNQATQPAANARVVRLFDTSASGPLSAYLDRSSNIGQDGTTLYISYLQQLPQGGTQSTGIVEFRRDGNGDSNTLFNTGVDTNPQPATYGLRLKRTASLTLAMPSGSDGELHRVVLKIEFGAGDNDTISLYQNPGLADEGNPIGSLSSSNLSFDRMGFGSFQGGQIRVGDIRFADNFNAVVPQAQVGGHLLELVAGDGDDDNGSFRILNQSLVTSAPLTTGGYTVRIEATDTSSNSVAQAVGVYVGDGLADDDQDSLTNVEEVANGLDPSDPSDALLDHDGDSQSTFIEIQAGTDPFDAASKFGVNMLTALPKPLLRIDAGNGAFFYFEESTDLVSWSPYGRAFSLADGGSLVELPAPEGDESHKFYRLHAGTSAIAPVDLLANGLAGWVVEGNDPSEWTYDSTTGVIKHVRQNTGGFLRYPGAFSDFVLRLEYRASAGANSGVFTRAPEGSLQPWIDGNEIQIDNDDVEGADRETGSIYRRIAAVPYDPAPDQWHSMEIIHAGAGIRVTIDGLVVIDEADVTDSYPEFTWPMSGYIGLQDSHHNPQGSSIEYRNIQLYPLP